CVGILADLEVRDLPALASAIPDSLGELIACAQAQTAAAVGASPSGSAATQTATRIVDGSGANASPPLPSAPRPI
ncbi:MAG TPA: hypothetical protein VG496_01200, partial [Myxococcales bacterium]|nr:hypothetical protein [Myxococcales bacterium]